MISATSGTLNKVRGLPHYLSATAPFLFGKGVVLVHGKINLLIHVALAVKRFVFRKGMQDDMHAFIERIDIYPEKPENGIWIKNIVFAFPVPVNGKEIKEYPLEKLSTVDVVVVFLVAPMYRLVLFR